MQGKAAQQQQHRAPPRGWTDFFPAQDYFAPDDCRAQLVNDISQFLSTAQGSSLLLNTFVHHGQRIVSNIDYAVLNAQCNCTIKDAVICSPQAALQCLQVAITEHLLNQQAAVSKDRFGAQVVEVHPGCCLVRLCNVVDCLVPIRSLKSSLIGKYASLKGTVVRMSPVRPLVTQMPFVCGKCGTVQVQDLPDGKYTPPTRCTGQGCKAKTFEACRSEAVCTDWQKIRLQEIIGSDKQQEGQVPRTVEVELTGDLVGSAVVGDVITVFGEVKVLATGETLGQYGSVGGGPIAGGPMAGAAAAKSKQQSLFLIYLNAQSVHNVSRANRLAADRSATGAMIAGGPSQFAGGGGGGGGMGGTAAPNMAPFTQRDLEFIIKFTEECEGDQLRQLVHALCPPIYGHEMVKAGLILALMGGVRKNEGVQGRVPIRGDIHVLVVGDPGLGKSQLLQAAAAAAPRGLYVCGNTSSSAGLTVSVVKDSVTGDYVFEAGAVVLGDRGVCCVDEFDKMTTEHQSLLEAMEQQEVSVAKAGMVSSLPARTAILAAANPVEGHYNKAKSVAENLRMTPAMLSRFDLIFILMDRPDELMDQCLSEHVLALHSGLTGRAEQAKQRMLQFSKRVSDNLQLEGPQGGQPLLLGSAEQAAAGIRRPLKDRLKMGPNDDHRALLPLVLVRKYIAYARQYVTPVLSDDAKVVLQDFYLQLRQQVPAGSSSPITARQLESLARLAEARARVELRPIVTKEDAEDVIEIMKDALYDKFGGLDDAMLGCVDYRTQPGAGKKGKAAEAARFVTKLKSMAGRQGRDTFSTGELFAVATEMNLQVKDISACIDSLNEAGDLLKAGPGQFKVRGVVPATPASSQGTQGAGNASQLVPGGFGMSQGTGMGNASQGGPAGQMRRFGNANQNRGLGPGVGNASQGGFSTGGNAARQPSPTAPRRDFIGNGNSGVGQGVTSQHDMEDLGLSQHAQQQQRQPHDHTNAQRAGSNDDGGQDGHDGSDLYDGDDDMERPVDYTQTQAATRPPLAGVQPPVASRQGGASASRLDQGQGSVGGMPPPPAKRPRSDSDGGMATAREKGAVQQQFGAYRLSPKPLLAQGGTASGRGGGGGVNFGRPFF